MNKKYDIIVFGATGFTGSLICEYLASHKENKQIKWAIAGRNKTQLKKLATKYSLDMFVADSFNQDSLDSICSKTKLIISTVGPYDIYGEKLVIACLNEKSHYLDLTGEPAFVKKIHDKYSDAAESNDTILMHCCGFESIPPDLATYLSVKELDSENIDATYYLKTKGKISGGTWASFLNSITSKQPIVGSNRTKKNSKKIFYSKRFKKWALIFPVIDKYIVIKSSKNNIKEYGKNFLFSEYILLPSLLSAILLIFGITLISFVSKINILKTFLLNQIPSGKGPSKEERANHWFKAIVVAKSEDKEIVTTISGGDPGYGETSKFISEMALCILLEYNSLLKNKGILTPVECTGDLMMNRLKNVGIKFDISKSSL